MPKPTFFNLAPAKRARLVDAAIVEFAETSYLGGSLDRIAAAAGISKGSLYQYFENKLDLYTWLLSDEFPRQKRDAIAASPAQTPEADLFEVLEAAFFAGLRLFVASPHLARLGASLLHPAPVEELKPLHHQCAAQAHAGLRHLVVSAQQTGEVAAELDPDLVTGMIAGMMGTGPIDSLLQHVGKDQQSLRDEGLALHALDEAELQRLVRQTTDMLRRAFSTTTSPRPLQMGA